MVSSQDYYYSYSERGYVALCILDLLFYTEFMSNHAKFKLVPRMLLLFCIFFAAQSQAVAHEFDHLASGDNGSCVVCSVGSNLEAAATNSADLFALTAPAATRPAGPDHLSRAAVSTGFSARAPPSFL